VNTFRNYSAGKSGILSFFSTRRTAASLCSMPVLFPRRADVPPNGRQPHIPLKVNAAGMIPIIFSMSLVIFPGMIAQFFMKPATSSPNFWNAIYNIFNPNTSLPLGVVYWILYFFLTILASFFYTMVIFQQQDLPGTLQKQGGLFRESGREKIPNRTSIT